MSRGFDKTYKRSGIPVKEKTMWAYKENFYLFRKCAVFIDLDPYVMTNILFMLH